jgi:hypothetical protein
LESLVTAAGLCSPTDPCRYHAAKRNDVSMSVPTVVIGVDGSKGVMHPSAGLAKVVELTEAAVGQPAGSWNLLLEEKSWFVDRVAEAAAGIAGPVRVAVFGIAGLPHFVDTYRLLRNAVGTGTPLQVSVIDRCLTPLSTIAEHCRGAGIAVALRDVWSPHGAGAGCSDGDGLVELVRADLVRLPAGGRSFHVVVMHYLLRFMAQGPAARCLRLARTLLGPVDGALIAAQDRTPFMPTSPDGYFARHGFRVLTSERVWAPYKLSAAQRDLVRRRLPVEVDRDCWLLHMKVAPGAVKSG